MGAVSDEWRRRRRWCLRAVERRGPGGSGSWTAGGLDDDLLHKQAEAQDAARPSGAKSSRRRTIQALSAVVGQADAQYVVPSTCAVRASSESTTQCRAGK